MAQSVEGLHSSLKTLHRLLIPRVRVRMELLTTVRVQLEVTKLKRGELYIVNNNEQVVMDLRTRGGELEWELHCTARYFECERGSEDQDADLDFSIRLEPRPGKWKALFEDDLLRCEPAANVCFRPKRADRSCGQHGWWGQLQTKI